MIEMALADTPVIALNGARQTGKSMLSKRNCTAIDLAPGAIWLRCQCAN
jgi:hypothetical protein